MSNGLPFMDISGLDPKVTPESTDIVHLQDIFGLDSKMTVENLVKNISGESIQGVNLTANTVNAGVVDSTNFKAKGSWGLVSERKGYRYSIPNGVTNLLLPDGIYTMRIINLKVFRLAPDGATWYQVAANGNLVESSLANLTFFCNGTNLSITNDSGTGGRITLYGLSGDFPEISGYTPNPIYDYT